MRLIQEFWLGFRVSTTEEMEPPQSAIGKLRFGLYRILFETPNAPKIHYYLDRFIITLIVLSVIAIGLEHIPSIHEEFHWEFALFDKISVIIFTIEYILRLLCGGMDPKFRHLRFKTVGYALTPMALLDFLVVVPFYLTFLIELDLRYLRLFRLMRIFKLLRYFLPVWQRFCVFGGDTPDPHLLEVPMPTSLIGKGRYWLFRVMFETKNAPKLYYIVDKIIVSLIVASVIAIIFEHVETIHEAFHWEFALFDKVSVIIFTLEYVLRMACAGLNPKYGNRRFKTLRHALAPMSVVDFFVIVPFYLTFLINIDLRFLRLLRLLRIFKLARFLLPILQNFKELNEGRTFRQKVFSVLNEDAYSGRVHHLVDVALVGLIFLSVVAVVTESVHSIHEAMAWEFRYFDLFSVAIFSTEYLFRVYSSVENPKYAKAVKGRFAYMTTPGAIIDLLAILPFYLTLFIHIDLRFLRVMRLLRILKLTRYSTAITTVIEVITEELPSLGAALFVLCLITIFSASIIYLVESDAQPEKFSSIPESMYWAIITLTSIGYGDIYPVTPIGQMLTMVIATVGLGMIALPTGILATGFNEKIRARTEEYKRLVREKAEDGVITEEEQRELDQKARELGIKTSNIERLGAEELEDLAKSAALGEKSTKFRSTTDSTQLIGPVMPQVAPAPPPVERVPLPVMRAEPEDPIAEESVPMRTTPAIRGLALSFGHDDTIEAVIGQISQMSLHQKSVLMARLAVNMSSDAVFAERMVQNALNPAKPK